MKNIKELGLELIELEDQVLLVKNGDTPKNWYLDDANQIRKSITDDPDWWSARLGYRSILASTKPLEGIPLLVIEDNVIGKPLDDYIRTKTNQDQCVGFIEGYNKAKEKFKFTEDDMVEFAMNMISQYQFGNTNIHNRSMLRESLPKKELWIEVDCTLVGLDLSDNCQPKIINNQIKGIYR